jgi:uncharacterized membrane protein
MNYRILSLALALLLLTCAYLTFDWNDWTQMAISTVLFLSGLHWLLVESESIKRRELGRSCLRLAAIIAVFLIVKLLIFG